MSQTTRVLKLTIITALLLLLAGIVMACGSTPKPLPRPDAQPAPAEVEVAVVPPPTPSTTSEEPTPPPAIMAPDDGCVECHTNEETLQATAEEEEEGGEALSEGEG